MFVAQYGDGWFICIVSVNSSMLLINRDVNKDWAHKDQAFKDKSRTRNNIMANKDFSRKILQGSWICTWKNYLGYENASVPRWKWMESWRAIGSFNLPSKIALRSVLVETSKLTDRRLLWKLRLTCQCVCRNLRATGSPLTCNANGLL